MLMRRGSAQLLSTRGLLLGVLLLGGATALSPVVPATGTSGRAVAAPTMPSSVDHEGDAPEQTLPDCGPIEMGGQDLTDADPDGPSASCKVPETNIGVSNPVEKHPIPLNTEGQ